MRRAKEILDRAQSTSLVRQVPAWTGLMIVLAEDLQEIRDTLPAPTRTALDDAAWYWASDERNPETLAAAKERCWSYLDSVDGSGRDARLTRATLCVLEPSGDVEDAAQSAEWFTEMLNGID